MPVRLRARETGNAPFVTGYIVAVGNEPVAEPAMGALRQILDSAWNGPKPATILLSESSTAPGDIAKQEAEILEWLTAAWRGFRAACDPRYAGV